MASLQSPVELFHQKDARLHEAGTHDALEPNRILVAMEVSRVGG